MHRILQASFILLTLRVTGRPAEASCCSFGSRWHRRDASVCRKYL